MSVDHSKHNVLICTVGLPRSGKSTWSRKQKIPVVNLDSIRYALYGQRFWKAGEHLIKPHALIMIRSLFMAGHKFVISDECNCSCAQREYWIHGGFDSEFVGWNTVFKVFDVKPDVCKSRANDVLKPVIDKMASFLYPYGELYIGAGLSFWKD